MSLGTMMAGGNPKNGRNENDFYPTPDAATVALLNHYRDDLEGKTIWEPACGNGAIAKVFEREGFTVYGTDLYDYGYGEAGHDFTTTFFLHHDAEAIITNPPFNEAVGFIQSARRLQPEFFALLLKSTYFHAKNRYELFCSFPPTGVHPLTWRLDFMNLGRPTMECSWFVWGPKKEYQYVPFRKPEINP